jgi:hypothetical protein
MTDQTKTGTEIIAREIAMWHGSAVIMRKDGETHTVASMAGLGHWGHSAEKYSEKYWHQYIGAAEAMLARINRISEEPELPSPST